MQVIELTQVKKRFGRQIVLDGLDLQVPSGSVFAFLGNNGAGKSTTISLMTGLQPADSGQIRILGQDLQQNKMAILRQIGCLVDAPSLYSNLTAQEFLRIGCLLKNLAKTEIARVLELVSLRSQSKIAHFSLGMKQRLALAHAMLGAPKLLILDEPGNGLDPQGIQEIRALLRQLPQAANCTVFVSSHQLDEVEKFASHLALLRNGRVLGQHRIADVLAQQHGVLALQIDDADKAALVLAQYACEKTAPDQLEVAGIAWDQADQIHAKLIHAGVRLFQSSYRKPSLEDWFFAASAGEMDHQEKQYAAQ